MLYKYDRYRMYGKYSGGVLWRDPGMVWLYFYRKTQESSGPLHALYSIMKRYYGRKYRLEILTDNIGKGLYLGHPYGITVNPETVIGDNCNLHKGVTIGQENRGRRKGAPVIGNKVWIGVNATIVGNIRIGDDVLIASNSFVNRDIPSHSIVFGNPCMVKSCEHATCGYINNIVEE